MILDHDRSDPKWLLAEISGPDCIKPAALGTKPGGPGWAEVNAWLRGVLGLDQASLVPLHRPEVWSIE